MGRDEESEACDVGILERVFWITVFGVEQANSPYHETMECSRPCLLV